MRKLSWIVAFFVGAAGFAAQARAEVSLHGLFTDNMVLQEGAKVAVWGKADAGEKVVVKMQGQEVSTAADKDGKWLVQLNNLKTGGPFELSAGDKTLKNVLVGEVWLCTGQSNMEWSLKSTRDADKNIAAASHPQIRLFQVPKTPNGKPQTELGTLIAGKKGEPLIKLTAAWKECSPATVPGFSAVGYYFGRDLHLARKVPVGLIESAWGGTAAERWTRAEIFDMYPELKGLKGSDLYNGMIAPLLPFTVKGAIWYQGESNAGQAYRYRTLFPAMIKNWRDDFKQDLLFLFVQLAPWDVPKEPTWPELREAQLLTAQKVPNTAMAVITDYGDRKDIHPQDKEPVGARLALAARAVTYGEKIPYSGPEYTGMKVDGSRAILSFKHVEGGLVAKGGALTGFTICGADKNFVKAEASIAGDTVIVTSAEVTSPVAVRYGWANFPVVNLYNKAGLPASPFRTDDFPSITAK